MNICIVVGSAPFDISYFKQPQPGDYVICADGGYDRIKPLGLLPDLLVGDFDSMENSEQCYPCEVIRLLPEKDDTDMMKAVKIALSKGWKKFYLYGGLGGDRLDHTVANFQLLSYLLDQGAKGVLLDGKTRVMMLENETLVLPKEDESYLSVFAYTESCPDVTLKGVKYPLEHAKLTSSFPLGTSNEIVSSQAQIITKGGKLLVMLTPKSSL